MGAKTPEKTSKLRDEAGGAGGAPSAELTLEALPLRRFNPAINLLRAVQLNLCRRLDYPSRHWRTPLLRGCLQVDK